MINLGELSQLMGVVRRGVAEVLRVCPAKEITYLGTNLLDPLLQIATIYYTKQVIDHAANGRTDETVGYVALFVAVSAVLAVNAKVSRSVSPNLDRYLSHHGTLLLIEKVNSYPHLDLFDSRSLQDDLEVARRGHNLASVGAFVGALITNGAFILLSVAVLLSIGVWVPVVVLCSAIPRAVFRRKLELQEWTVLASAAGDRRRLEYLSETVTMGRCAKEVRAFGLGRYFVDAYRSEHASLHRRLNAIRIKKAFGTAIAGIVAGVGTGCVYAVIVVDTMQSHLTIGDLVLYTALVFRLHSVLDEAVSSLGVGYQRMLDVGGFFSFLDRPTFAWHTGSGCGQRSESSVSDASKVFVEFQSVTFFYPGSSTPALTDVSFALRQGETVALVGANGAGKTSLVRLLCGLYRPTEGRVKINGIDVAEQQPEELRGWFGVLTQDFVRYQLRVRDNIGFGDLQRMESDAVIWQASSAADATTFLAEMPDELETILGREFEGGVGLSDGQWQRVALARGLMKHAPVLVLDEPTASLDAETEASLFDRLVGLARGRTALLVSHRLSGITSVDRILVFDKGRLVEAGTHDHLMSKKNLYRKLYEMQAERYLS